METSLISWQIAVQIILALLSFIGLFLSFNATLDSKFNSLRTELRTDIEKLSGKVENLRVDQGKLEQRLEHLETTTNEIKQKVSELDYKTKMRVDC